MSNQDKAEEVKSTRGAQGLTQEQLAEKAGIKSVRTIRNLEAGKPVSPATEAAVYRALGIPGPTPAWPEDVDVFLRMIGYRLSAMEDEERMDLMLAITRMAVGR